MRPPSGRPARVAGAPGAPGTRAPGQPPARGLLEAAEAFVLDCDGVLWSGGRAVEGAAAAVAEIRRRGAKVQFLTNNSSKSRKQYVAKFASFGIRAAPEEIVGSAYLAAAYLESVGFDRRKKVFLIGSRGVEEELTELGIDFVGGEDDAYCDRFWKPSDGMAPFDVDPDIGCVLVGWDGRFSYKKILYASLALQQLGEECLFVATNRDAADRVGGWLVPGTGPLVTAVEEASGRSAVNVGKGGQWLLDGFLLARGGLPEPGKCCVVGDRLDTDIKLGKQAGMLTALTLTGVTSRAEAEAAPEAEAPDVVLRSIADLLRP